MRVFGAIAVKFRDPADLDPASIAAVIRSDGVPPKDWLVRGADGTRPNRSQRFSGADALVKSLKYAHDKYSRVRWLMEF